MISPVNGMAFHRVHEQRHKMLWKNTTNSQNVIQQPLYDIFHVVLLICFVFKKIVYFSLTGLQERHFESNRSWKEALAKTDRTKKLQHHFKGDGVFSAIKSDFSLHF